MRKLQMELRGKGVDVAIVEQVLASTDRADTDELQKIIAKKASRYDDVQKLTAYLVRQGFHYDDVKEALSRSDDE